MMKTSLFDRPVASLLLHPDWRELDSGRCTNMFNGALVKPLRGRSNIGQVSFYVITHIVPSGGLLGVAKEAHVLCNFPVKQETWKYGWLHPMQTEIQGRTF